MARYRLRTPEALEAFLWLGANHSEAQEFFAPLPFSSEKTADDLKTLTVRDPSGSTRWFVRPDTYVFVKENMLRTVPREKFEALYEEVS